MYSHSITNKNKINLSLLTKINALLLLSAIVLSLVYVGFINSNTLKAYAMRDIEKRLVTLKEMNEKMEFDLTELQSVDHIKTAALEMGLVATDKIEYIKADTGVALNR